MFRIVRLQLILTDWRFADWNPDDPSSDPQARGDPFRTLFVARLSYDVKESDLEREFGRFGPIERVNSVFWEVVHWSADSSRFVL